MAEIRITVEPASLDLVIHTGLEPIIQHNPSLGATDICSLQNSACTENALKGALDTRLYVSNHNSDLQFIYSSLEEFGMKAQSQHPLSGLFV